MRRDTAAALGVAPAADQGVTTITVVPGARATRASSIHVRITFKNSEGFFDDTVTFRGQRLWDVPGMSPYNYTVVSRVDLGNGESEPSEAYIDADLPLQPGANELLAYACPWPNPTPTNRCVTRRDTFTYDPNLDVDPPSAGFTPGSHSRHSDSVVPVTVEWTDNRALVADSIRLTLNGVPVPGFTYTPIDAARGRSTGTLTLQEGTNTLVARACDAVGNCGGGTARYVYTPPPPSEVVVSKMPLPGVEELEFVGEPLDPGAGEPHFGPDMGWAAESPGALRFRVTNVGGVASRYLLAAECSGTTSSCTAPAALELAPGEGREVWVRFHMGAEGSMATVALTARHPTQAGYEAGAFVRLSAEAAANQAPEPALDKATALAIMERSLCLTASAGAGAAYECGDLRLAHGLPGIRSLNRGRAPTLLYNSQHASPAPRVAVDVFQSPVTATGSGVEGRLQLTNSGATFSYQWSAAGLTPGESRRVVMGGDSLSYLPTGVHPFTAQVGYRRQTAVAWSGLVGGEMVVVNRASSPFGPGLWLTGLEQLFPIPGNRMLWVGGDGSTRIYRPSRANVWHAERVDRLDSLTLSGGMYQRHLSGGAKVWFNAFGQHERTVDRLGQATVFTYTGARLTSIQVPPSSAGLVYHFIYGVNGRLARVDAPGGIPGRSTTITWPAGEFVIAEPDGHAVRYRTDARGRVTSRVDRRGTETAYTYGAMGLLTRSGLAVGGDSVAVSFRAAEGEGAVGPVRVVDVATRIDGPRRDVGDTTVMWLDRFGAPQRVMDALGRTAEVERSNPEFPAHVTRSRAPNGMVSTAEYDDRGRVFRTTQINPLGDGVHPSTLYRYDDRWDALSRMVAPNGDSTVISYDAVGNREWQQAGGLDSTRVYFRHTAQGLVDMTWTEAGSRRGEPAQRYEYDPARFNLSATVSPMGRRVEMHADAVGRDTVVTSPLEGALRMTTRTGYDAADRVRWTRTDASATDDRNGAQSVLVETTYDPEGTPLRTARTQTPDPNGIGVLWTEWTPDAAGRVTSQTSSDQAVERTDYNEAGQVIAFTPRPTGRALNGGALTIRTRYDALGRMVERVLPALEYEVEPVRTLTDQESYPRFPLHTGLAEKGVLPGDTLTFVYDAAGDMVVAANRDAVVTRGYYPNGAPRTDTIAIRGYEGESYTTYGIGHAYDYNGRRTRLEYPQNVVGAGAGVNYAYHPQLGSLATLSELGGGVFQFGYAGDGGLTSQVSPGGISETIRYTADGQLRKRIVTANNAYVGTASGLPGSSIRSDSIAYDERGKVRWAGNFGEEMTNTYAAMGALSLSQSQTPWSTQRMLVDPLGNIQRDSSTTRGADTPGTQTTVRFPMYSGDGTGRLRATHTFDPSRNSMSGPYSESTLTALDTTLYDGAGNRVRYNSSAEIRRDEVGPGVTESLRLNEATRYYYDAVGQLRATDRRRCVARPISGRYQCVGWEPAPGRDPGVYEEYRYDALGRRVMVGTRPQENQCQAGNDVCTASLVTTVWDGDQLLVENRATAYSADWVAYTHGGGIDAPLAVRARVNALGASSARDFIPLSNWRGLYDAAVFADGSTVQDGFDLTQIEWPAKNYRAYFDYVAPENTRSQVWVGSLMTHKRDASGQLYMRNRYFDPASGRFTQEDPIGIAGGLNLYAFGGGDPVTYSDPYGLMAAGTDGCDPPLPCRVSDWGGGGPEQTRGLGHVKKRHVNGTWGDQFVDMDDKALRRVVSGTVEGGEMVGEQLVGGQRRFVFERTWGTIGTRGQRIARVVLGESGELITAFPVRNAYSAVARRALGTGATSLLIRGGLKAAAVLSGVGVIIDIATDATPLGSAECPRGLCQ